MKRAAVDFPIEPDAERLKHFAPALEMHRLAIHQDAVEIEQDGIIGAHFISV